jgi:hypothetical protein
MLQEEIDVSGTMCPHHQGSDDIRTLMMGTEMFQETSISSCNQLTRLCAREDYIEVYNPIIGRQKAIHVT